MLMFARSKSRRIAACLTIMATLIIPLGMYGCRSKTKDVVTLYCSVDEPFARHVIEVFTHQTGISVDLKLDTESGKTTGLVRRLRAERDRPRADVFWSSELFNTIRLAREGLLAEYRPPTDDIPDQFKDPGGRWTAFGLRARVLAYNTSKIQPDQLPARWRDISSVQWQGVLGVADPQFGTTGGHFAAMYALWGRDEYVKFLDELRTTVNGRLLDGNATAARLVGRGELALCMTDTDDVYVCAERGDPIAFTSPDLGDGGTLVVPNSVALIEGSPHPQAGRKLIDFLASPQTERMLAQSESRNIPVRAALRSELDIELPQTSRISFDRVADAMEPAIQLAREHLLQTGQ